MTATIIGAAAASIWLYLLAFHGRFWWVRQQAVAVSAAPRRSIVAVIPARDEETVIGRAVASLMAQRYPGPFHVVVVDDQSSDGTAAAARAVAAGRPDRLTRAPRRHCWGGGWEGRGRGRSASLGLWYGSFSPAPEGRLSPRPFFFFFSPPPPPRLVADPARRTAAAAGGCMLIRRNTLERIGG